MKHHSDRQIQIMRLALGLSGLPCNDAQAETVLLVISEMERCGKSFSIKESSNIEYYIKKKYYSPQITAQLKTKKKSK